MHKLFLTYEEGMNLPKETDEYVLIQCPDQAGFYVMHPGCHAMYDFYQKRFVKYHQMLSDIRLTMEKEE